MFMVHQGYWRFNIHQYCISLGLTNWLITFLYFPFFLLFFLNTESHIDQASLQYTMKTRLAFNSWFSCLHLLKARITDVTTTAISLYNLERWALCLYFELSSHFLTNWKYFHFANTNYNIWSDIFVVLSFGTNKN